MRRIATFLFLVFAAIPVAARAQLPFGATQNSATKVVNWRELAPSLPDSLGGFRATAPVKGSSSAAMGFTVSEVERIYKQGSITATVKITDTNFNPMMLGAMQMGIGVTEDSSDHYQRPVTVSGMQGSEKWSQNKQGEVTVIAGRFLVTVEAGSVPDTKELLGLAGKIDFARLSSIGK